MTPPPRTLGDTLALARLTHREARLERSLRALRDRLHDAERRGEPIPAALRAAIAGFAEELAQVRQGLRELAGPQARDTVAPATRGGAGADSSRSPA